MQRVTIIEDTLDAGETVEVEDIREFLLTRFAEFPETARIYHGEPNAQNDVTPYDEKSIERLGTLEGPFYVVVYPEQAAIPYIIAAIVAAIIAYAVASNIPIPTVKDQGSIPSPNNDLAARQNSARPFQRIPDIYGTVRSTPDLIMLPYSEYRQNVEYEHAYMCIGRGDFDVFDAHDDTTPIPSIDGAGVTVYRPGDSPNAPLPGVFDRTIFGNPNAASIQNVSRITSVNGQDLLTDSTTEQIGTVSTMVFSMPVSQPNGFVQFTGGEDLSGIAPDQIIYLFVKSYKTHHTTKDTYLSGNYVVVSVTTDTVELKNVQSVANDWGWLRDWPSEFVVTESHMVTQDALQVGPFLLPQTDQTQVWCNLVALNGLYKVDGSGNVTAVNVGLEAIIQPCDPTGNATGDPYRLYTTLLGDERKNTIAISWKLTLVEPITSIPAPGPCLITLVRTTASPVSAQVSDAVKWKDLLSLTPVDLHDFGNVTTCYSITKATSGALAVKQRKLNLLVQRRLPTYLGGGTFGDLVSTSKFADSLIAAATDPYIGNRSLSELDVDGYFATGIAIADYFGTDNAQEFCYTFDSNNLSFEEIAQTMCASVFSVAYRQGAQLRVAFEKETDDSVMLFGHRNKLPGTEQRAITFGPLNDYDSIQLDYVSPIDDSKVTLYVPTQGVNPKNITAAGVRNYYQAYFLAWRAWNRLKYQNTSTEFSATQEAAIVKLNDRVLVADNTRSQAQDGEVVSQTGMELELSQPVVFASGKDYVIMLQGIDGNVESIPIIAGSSDYHVVMSTAPSVTLSLDENAAVRALYWIVATDDTRPQAFLVSKREPGDTSFTQKVTAVNYDVRYYANDGDLIAAVIGSGSGPDGRKHILPIPPGGGIA